MKQQQKEKRMTDKLKKRGEALYGKQASATAQGRAKQGQSLQSSANQRMVEALQTGDFIRGGGENGPGPAPAQYGNLKGGNGKAKVAKTGAQAMYNSDFANYHPMRDTEAKAKADRKQAKEGRR